MHSNFSSHPRARCFEIHPTRQTNKNRKATISKNSVLKLINRRRNRNWGNGEELKIQKKIYKIGKPILREAWCDPFRQIELRIGRILAQKKKFFLCLMIFSVRFSNTALLWLPLDPPSRQQNRSGKKRTKHFFSPLILYGPSARHVKGTE